MVASPEHPSALATPRPVPPWSRPQWPFGPFEVATCTSAHRATVMSKPGPVPVLQSSQSVGEIATFQ